MNTQEELEKRIKELERNNTLLKQSLKQDHILRKSYNEAMVLLRKKDEELEELNNSLEHKVQERTTELAELYEHEQHVKEMMRMVADVNEYLAGAMNMQSIIKNSIKNICNYDEYNFSWFGMLTSENTLEVIYKSKDIYNLVPNQEYSLLENPNNIVIQNVFNTIKSGQTTVINNVLEHFPQMKKRRNSDLVSEVSEFRKRRENDYILYSLISIPLFYDGEKSPFAVCNIHSSKLAIDEEEQSILENLGKDIAFAMSINRHRNILENLELEKVSNYEETILAFVDIIEQRDAYTAGHTLRVAQYCRKISEVMNISEKDISKLEKAAILHDIGKVVTPDSILLKPGRLSSLEYDLIKQHAVSGYKMLSKIAMYKDLADIIKYHHEHYDGTGYPEGKKGHEISLLTHIMIVADAFDAMTTNRIYKGRKTIEEALQEIKNLLGIHFKPEVVDAALEALKDININDTTQLPQNELEQKRFSYFFQDSLTSLHNETYLSVLINKGLPNFQCLNLLLLRNFTDYNRRNGWGSGNELLTKIAHKLQKDYPDSQIFRFHGDDFVVLSKNYLDVNIDVLNKEFKEKYNVYFDLHHYDTRDFDSVKELFKTLD